MAPRRVGAVQAAQGEAGPRPPRAGSPEDQLSKALENVRESRRLRIDEAPVADDNENVKDW